MNENGQRMLELYCQHELCISNTFFNTKPQHRVSWRHPRSKHWHQLDLILTRHANLSSIKLTRTYQSGDCDTDHSLVCSKVKFQARRLHCTKKEGRPHIDASKTRDQTKVKEFSHNLEESFPGPPTANAQQRWQYFRDSIYNAAMSTFGKKTSNSADWLEAHSEEMTPVIKEKRRALAAYKTAADTGNVRVMYDGIKQALGPTQKKSAPLKSTTGGHSRLG
ncbi:uncharacterized protein [Penaeus vannamei]|uniref:uncharacterized protein n=1 Tax=Penaeus vannamei TaxID=6689 RepID=UPI00387F9BA6